MRSSRTTGGARTAPTASVRHSSTRGCATGARTGGWCRPCPCRRRRSSGAGRRSRRSRGPNTKPAITGRDRKLRDEPELEGAGDDEEGAGQEDAVTAENTSTADADVPATTSCLLVPKTAYQRERREQRVEPGLGREPGQSGVHDHLRDQQVPDREPGHDVARQPRLPVQREPGDDRYVAPEHAVNRRVGHAAGLRSRHVDPSDQQRPAVGSRRRAQPDPDHRCDPDARHTEGAFRRADVRDRVGARPRRRERGGAARRARREQHRQRDVRLRRHAPARARHLVPGDGGAAVAEASRSAAKKP